jgi:hypothetical protein
LRNGPTRLEPLGSQVAVRWKRSEGTPRLSPLTGECISGRLCGLRNREQHVDKLAQRTAGRDPSWEGDRDCGVVCRRRSERRMLVRGRAYGSGPRLPGWLRLAQQQQVSQRTRVAITRSAGFRVSGFVRLGPGRFYGITFYGITGTPSGVRTLRCQRRRFGVVLVESLILAQDQRWRRA